MANFTYTKPDHSFDEPSSKQFRVSVSIPGIESERVLTLRACMPKFVPHCRNGKLNIEFAKRGFKLRFDGKNNLKDSHLFLKVQDLPGDVNIERSSFKITDARVEILLIKVEPSSWMGALVEGLRAVDPALEPPPPYKE